MPVCLSQEKEQRKKGFGSENQQGTIQGRQVAGPADGRARNLTAVVAA